MIPRTNDEMLAWIREHGLNPTPEECAAQRRSYVIGEMLMEHPEMAREDAEALVDRVIATKGCACFDMAAFSRSNRRRSEASNGFNHQLSAWSLSEWMTATLGELGEAANVLKKLNRARDGIVGNSSTVDELKSQFADELADTFIYLDLLAQASGIDLAEAVRTKFECTSRKIGYVE